MKFIRTWKCFGLKIIIENNIFSKNYRHIQKIAPQQGKLSHKPGTAMEPQPLQNEPAIVRLAHRQLHNSLRADLRVIADRSILN
jgi:hypothetical protein